MPDKDVKRLQKALLNLTKKGQEKMLLWTAIDIRSKARSVLNRRGISGKGKRITSKPGEAPRKVKGTIRDFILYELNKENNSVIIGPKHLPGKPSGVRSVSHILQEGGAEVIKKAVRVRKMQKWAFKTTENSYRAVNSPEFQEYIKRNTVIKTAYINIQRRPFMDKALYKALEKERLNKRFKRALRATSR